MRHHNEDPARRAWRAAWRRARRGVPPVTTLQDCALDAWELRGQTRKATVGERGWVLRHGLVRTIPPLPLP